MAGLQLADASIWLLTAMTLAVCNITKAVEDGVEIIPEVDVSSEGVRYDPAVDTHYYPSHEVFTVISNLSNAPSNLDLQRLWNSFNKISNPE